MKVKSRKKLWVRNIRTKPPEDAELGASKYVQFAVVEQIWPRAESILEACGIPITAGEGSSNWTLRGNTGIESGVYYKTKKGAWRLFSDAKNTQKQN